MLGLHFVGSTWVRSFSAAMLPVACWVGERVPGELKLGICSWNFLPSFEFLVSSTMEKAKVALSLTHNFPFWRGFRGGKDQRKYLVFHLVGHVTQKFSYQTNMA